MRTLFIIPILLMSLVSFPSWGMNYEDLVKREGLYYEKFTDIAFSGDVKGTGVGKIVSGKRVGYWEFRNPDGSLISKVNFENGKGHGAAEYFYGDGNISSKGNWLNGRKEGTWVYFHENGQLSAKGNYSAGEIDGYWVHYYENGDLWSDLTGLFRNGEKIGN